MGEKLWTSLLAPEANSRRKLAILLSEPEIPLLMPETGHRGPAYFNLPSFSIGQYPKTALP